MIQVYTGDGKGKTTAALGQALRASGHGMRVMVIQFMKAGGYYGESLAAPGVEGLEIRSFGRMEFVDRDNPSEEDKELAARGIAFARKCLDSGAYDLMVLDELNVAVDFGLIPLTDALNLLERGGDTEIIVTGRGAPAEFTRMANLVSEIREIKHPFREGISARKGFDY